MNRVRNCRIQSNAGLVVSTGSTVCVIRIGLKYNGILPMLNGIGRNLLSRTIVGTYCILPMLNDIGRNQLTNEGTGYGLPVLNGIGRNLPSINISCGKCILPMLNGIGQNKKRFVS